MSIRLVVCRLLDDNRELFVPELQETIKPHPHFMLFATQNPPGEAHRDLTINSHLDFVKMKLWCSNLNKSEFSTNSVVEGFGRVAVHAALKIYRT